MTINTNYIIIFAVFYLTLLNEENSMLTKNTKIKANIEPKHDDWRHIFQISNLFRQVSSVYSHTLNPAHKAAFGKITINQSKIISYIFSNSDKDIGIKTIARNLKVSAAAASQAIDRLVEAGLVVRKQDPQDRRAVMISVSPEGKKFLKSIQEESIELMGDIYKEIAPTEEELVIFRKILSQMNMALEKRWQKIINEDDNTTTTK